MISEKIHLKPLNFMNNISEMPGASCGVNPNINFDLISRHANHTLGTALVILGCPRCRLQIQYIIEGNNGITSAKIIDENKTNELSTELIDNIIRVPSSFNPNSVVVNNVPSY